MRNSLFYSKILLFGEYGIIEDSKGLSIPYNFYNGLLKISHSESKEILESRKSLKGFCDYLEALSSESFLEINIDTTAFREDIELGMYFDSSIPKGYGVGSSGALVAAVYDKYSNQKVEVKTDICRKGLVQLKSIFAIMESYFHGTSSGLDPLNSYLSLPILIAGKNPEIIGIPKSKTDTSKGSIFLIDSGVEGKTAPMLKVFLENMTQQSFRKMIQDEFIKYTENCIDNFLKGDISSLFSNIKQLSKIALNHFKPMIPKHFHKLWRQGLESNLYYLKLCGSGGGGYMLGFTEDIEKTKKLLRGYKIEIVYHF